MLEIVVIFIIIFLFLGICLWYKKKLFPTICKNVFFFCDCANIHSKQERITEPIIKNGEKTNKVRILRIKGKLKTIKDYCFRIFQCFGVTIDNIGLSLDGIQDYRSSSRWTFVPKDMKEESNNFNR
jgi:hypothetical protein